MKFAITDIETTGSYASGNSIIEIGICVVEDDKIIEEFHTLLNPGISLPPFITALTGIQTHMLASAPSFSQVADDIADIFKDAVFVAHNVNFDFSFFKAEFEALGMTFNPPKLCTIKLARKAFPGMRSYGLGNICRDLQIINDAPHRALGDARATTSLFYKCLANVDFDVVQKLMEERRRRTFFRNTSIVQNMISFPSEQEYITSSTNRGNLFISVKRKTSKSACARTLQDP